MLLCHGVKLRVVLCCSMCLFLQNQNFQRHTEHMMGLLAEGGRDATARLLHVNASLTSQVTLPAAFCVLICPYLSMACPLPECGGFPAVVLTCAGPVME